MDPVTRSLLNRVTHGDALEVLRQLPSEIVDLIRFACARVGWIAEFEAANKEASHGP